MIRLTYLQNYRPWYNSSLYSNPLPYTPPLYPLQTYQKSSKNNMLDSIPTQIFQIFSNIIAIGLS